MAEVVRTEQALETPAAPVTTPSEPKAAERPAGLPEKFKSWEDLAKSYTELEKKLGSKPEPEPAPVVTPPVDLDMSPYEAEYLEKGGLSEESYQALAGKNIPKAMVDNYIEGQKAIAAKLDAAAAAICGGEDNLKAVFEWAAANLSPEEKAAADSGLKSRDEASIKFVVKSLKAQFDGQFGKDPKLVGATKSSDSTSGYASEAEMIADMNNPLYKKDAAFRSKVERKLALTNL